MLNLILMKGLMNVTFATKSFDVLIVSNITWHHIILEIDHLFVLIVRRVSRINEILKHMKRLFIVKLY